MVVTVERKVVMVIAAPLQRPHPPVIEEGNTGEGDEVHGLGLGSDGTGFGGLQQHHLQQAMEGKGREMGKNISLKIT